MYEARGLNPDEFAFDEVATDLQRALAQLEEAAGALGIDLNTPLPPLPVSLEAERLKRAARAVLTAVLATRPELTQVATVLCLKATRVASYLEADPVREAWDADAVPNLVLIDRLQRELGAAAPDLEALADLDSIIGPLIAAVDGPGVLFEELVQRGAVPSPFCVVPET